MHLRTSHRLPVPTAEVAALAARLLSRYLRKRRRSLPSPLNHFVVDPGVTIARDTDGRTYLAVPVAPPDSSFDASQATVALNALIQESAELADVRGVFVAVELSEAPAGVTPAAGWLEG
jgi:hypothetical protein